MQTSIRQALRKSLTHNPYQWRATPIPNTFLARSQQFRMFRSSFGYFCFKNLHVLTFDIFQLKDIPKNTNSCILTNQLALESSQSQTMHSPSWATLSLSNSQKLALKSLREVCTGLTHPHLNNYNAMKEQIGAVESVKAASDIVCFPTLNAVEDKFNLMCSTLRYLER